MRFIFVLSTLLFSTPSWAAADGWVVGLAANYVLSQEVNLSGSQTSTANTYKPGIAAEIDLWHLPDSTFGFISGFIYNFPSGVSSSAVTTILSSGPATNNLQMNRVYIGSGYRLSTFYVPLALEYTIPTFDSGNQTTSSTKNGIGFLTGFGVLLDRFAVDFIYETAPMSMTATGNWTGGTTTETSSGTWTSTRLGLHYFF